MAASQQSEGGGDTGDLFPVTLVRGDNGEVGVALYQYIKNKGWKGEEIYISINGNTFITRDWVFSDVSFIEECQAGNWELVDGVGGVSLLRIALLEDGWCIIAED